MFKTKIENLSSDVRQKKREFQRHPASMTQSPDISGHSEKSCNSSLLIERIKLILREAFQHPDSSQSPVLIDEVAEQLKEAYR